jgi:hypothetical protein
MTCHDSLSDLHFQKQQAIDALDFEKACLLYNNIRNEIASQARKSILHIRDISFRQLKQIQSDFRQSLEALAEEKRILDSRLYSEFQVLFEQTRADHLNQLIALEKERGLTLISESEREIEEQIGLLERAKQAAMDSDFDGAIRLRSEAKEVGQAELERRARAVEEHFRNAKSDLLKQQQLELDQIAAMHEERFTRERNEMQEKQEKVTEEFQAGVKHIKHRTKVEILALSADEGLKNDEVQEALAGLDDLMREFEALPPVVAKLAHSEEMRVPALCPTRAAKNVISADIPSIVLQKGQLSKAKRMYPQSARTVSTPTTKLISRVYTGVCRPRAHGAHGS